MELFVVRQYIGDDFPSIKGNGFDGLRIGDDREEAEAFIAFVNKIIAAAGPRAWAYRRRPERVRPAR